MKPLLLTLTLTASLLPMLSSLAQTPKPSELSRVGALVIPKMQFAGASVAEAAQFLEIKSKELDPQKMGLALLVDDATRALTVPLTLDCTNVAVSDAVRYIAMMARLEVKPVGDALQLRHSAAVRLPFQAVEPTPRLVKRGECNLPKVQFSGASLEEAIDYFRFISLKQDPANGAVPIIIDPDLVGKKRATVTLNLTNVPLSKALTYTAVLVNAEVISLGDAFYIQPGK